MANRQPRSASSYSIGKGDQPGNSQLAVMTPETQFSTKRNVYRALARSLTDAERFALRQSWSALGGTGCSNRALTTPSSTEASRIMAACFKDLTHIDREVRTVFTAAQAVNSFKAQKNEKLCADPDIGTLNGHARFLVQYIDVLIEYVYKLDKNVLPRYCVCDIGFVPKNPLFNWEAATTEAANGYCVQGTKLHPYELAGCMVKCFEDHRLGTPNALELSYLARLVKDLEESRNLQGDYMRHVSWTVAKYWVFVYAIGKMLLSYTIIREKYLYMDNGQKWGDISQKWGYSDMYTKHRNKFCPHCKNHRKLHRFFSQLEIECANACGQLKFETGDIQTQLSDLSKRMATLEKGLDDLKKGAHEHKAVLNTCKNHIWALQNGGSIMGTSLVSNQHCNMAAAGNACQQNSTAPKRRIDMASSVIATTAKRVHTVRAGCEINTPLATPLFNAPAPPPFKPNLADIVIVLDDPSDPLGGFYPWQVEVQGHIFECILNGVIYCAIPTEDGPNFLAPYMNLYGLAWMEVRKTITEDSAFTQRTDTGEIKLLADEGLFAEFDNAKQWDARDAGDVYATVQANLIAPEHYMAKQRQNATLRRGYMPAILESVTGQQSNAARGGNLSRGGRGGKSIRGDNAQRGNGRGGRGNARGSQRGRGSNQSMKQRTAYQKTQKAMVSMREPVVESEQVVVTQQTGFQSGGQFNYTNAADTVRRAEGGVEQGQDEQDGAEVVLMGDDDQDDGIGAGVPAGGSSTAAGSRDGTYAGYAQASVAASLRTTSSLHAKLLKQVRMAGAAPKKRNSKQFRLSALDANNHLKCAKSLTHYIESTQPYEDATLLTDAVLGHRAKKMSDVVRMLHNGIDMGPQCEFRDIDHTCAIRVDPPKFLIENKNPYDYFFSILLLGDSTCASLTNFFGRDCAKHNIPAIVHSSKALFSGKRLPTIAAAASEVTLASTYDAVVIRCVLNSCDAEHCYALGIDIDVIESYFMAGISNCIAEIQNSAGISLQPSGKMIVSVIGPTLPRHMKNGWGRELLLDSFDFFYKVEGALYDLVSDNFVDVTVLPVMRFLRENHLMIHCGDESDAFLQMVCRDGLHTSKVGNAIISHLIRKELLKMWVI